MFRVFIFGSNDIHFPDETLTRTLDEFDDFINMIWCQGIMISSIGIGNCDVDVKLDEPIDREKEAFLIRSINKFLGYDAPLDDPSEFEFVNPYYD